MLGKRMSTSEHADEQALSAPGFVYAANSRDVAYRNGWVKWPQWTADCSKPTCLLLAREEGGSRALGRSANA